MSAPYTPSFWVDGPTGGTPLNAFELNKRETALADASTKAYAAYNALPVAGDNLDTWLTTFDTHLVSGQTYSDPSGTDVTNFLLGLDAVLRGDTTNSLLTALGFTITIGVEAQTKRRYARVVNEYDTARCWGAYLIDLSSPRFTGVVQAPHTVFDELSEFVALQVWRDNPGTLLMISGSHRTDTTGTNPRDVAHNTASLFHQIAAKYAAYGLPQLSCHGYADATDTAHDVIVSSGAANAGLGIRRVADAIEAAGFRVARSWVDTGNVLLGTTDVQGQAAATAGSPFCHIEINYTTRTTPASLAKLNKAIAAANYFGTIGQLWAPLANPVTGQFPANLGTANTAGSSVYYARADHIHKDPRNFPYPGDFGYVTWSCDPEAAVATASPTAGLLYVQRVAVRNATTITNLHCGVTATGTMTSGQNFMALFDSSGNRVGITADITTALGSTGEVKAALTTPYVISSSGTGNYYIGILLNGSPMITLARGGATVGGIGNANLTTSTRRHSAYGSAQTSVPSSITLSSLANTAHAPWLAAS